MQLSNVISDLVLFTVALASWLLGFSKLPKPIFALWGSFLLPVAMAALAGAGRFADLHPAMLPISFFFQHVASTLGAICLAAGGFQLCRGNSNTTRRFAWMGTAIAVGTVAFLLAQFGNFGAIVQWTPPIAMALIVVIGIVGLISAKGPQPRFTAILLILAVGLSGMAMLGLAKLSKPLSIDVYHYLLATSMASFGFAGRVSKAIIP